MEDVDRLASGDQSAKVDRRRPGRRDYDNPALIALLRSPSNAAVIEDAPDPQDATRSADDLAAARGIAVSLVIGVLMWSAIGLGIWALLRL